MHPVLDVQPGSKSEGFDTPVQYDYNVHARTFVSPLITPSEYQPLGLWIQCCRNFKAISKQSRPLDRPPGFATQYCLRC